MARHARGRISRHDGRLDTRTGHAPARLAVPGRSCWRLSRCDRVAVLVDACNFFHTFREAVKGARRSLYISAWDIDSRMALTRDQVGDGWPVTLAAFLGEALRRRPDLHCHILLWDVPLFYGGDREIMPALRLSWYCGNRCQVRLDNALPFEAAHHQKIVVIDDAIAFNGGLDLTHARWDSRDHLPDDPRRRRGRGIDPPFHDVQMMVGGAGAADLGRLFRERWRRATGETLSPPPPTGRAPWPAGVPALFTDTRVAICRTLAAWDGHSSVREVETVLLAAIAAARRWIYIEDQYMTSVTVAEALVRRLRESDGPDVVLILPRDWTGWLEARAMGYGRDQALYRMATADQHGRLYVGYPEAGGRDIKVHSKVMVVDDRLLRVGSANLTNRSLGLDSECDLVIEAAGDERIAQGIGSVLYDLLAEHLGSTPESVARTLARTTAGGRRGSLLATIHTLSGRSGPLTDAGQAAGPAGRAGKGSLAKASPAVGRTLWPFVLPDTPPEPDRTLGDPLLVDPPSPFDARRLTDSVIPGAQPSDARRVAWKLGLGAAVLIGAGLAWSLAPVEEWFTSRRFLAMAVALRDSPIASPLVIATFVIGGLVLFPVLVLITATALVFSPATAFGLAVVGCLASAAVGYLVGHLLGRRTVGRLLGHRINRVGRTLRRHGLVTVLLLRVAPVAPFGIINLASGAANIGFWDYALGTILGMVPGIAAITAFSAALRHSAVEGDPVDWILLATMAFGVVATAVAAHRFIARRRVRQTQEGR